MPLSKQTLLLKKGRPVTHHSLIPFQKLLCILSGIHLCQSSFTILLQLFFCPRMLHLYEHCPAVLSVPDHKIRSPKTILMIRLHSIPCTGKNPCQKCMVIILFIKMSHNPFTTPFPYVFIIYHKYYLCATLEL